MPSMALALSSSLATLPLPGRFQCHLAPSGRLPIRRVAASAVRAGALSGGYSGSYSGPSSAGDDEDEEVGEEAGSGVAAGFDDDLGLGLPGRRYGMSAVEAALAFEEREMPQCPPGLRPYETMVVLRPDMTEEERLALIQRYEELLVTGGAMYVEIFNRGVIPLAYSIRKRDRREGLTTTYYDGIYILMTYFTKPQSIAPLHQRLNTDDDVIRSCSFKVGKPKTLYD